MITIIIIIIIIIIISTFWILICLFALVIWSNPPPMECTVCTYCTMVSFSARLGPDDRLGSLAPDHMGTPVAGPGGTVWQHVFLKSQSLLVSCRRRLPSLSPIADGVQGGFGGGHSPLLVSLFACRRTEYGVRSESNRWLQK